MDFTLLYEGELLPSGGSNSRAKEKHAIRRSFHPQLRRLWSMKSNLQDLAERHSIPKLNESHAITKEDRIKLGLTAIGEIWSKGKYQFVPLVTAKMDLRCSLDITLLRPEEDRFIFTRGDIDGQIKTIFDALKMPANLGEAGGLEPQEDETPFFCLLEDDRLISEVRIAADQLLLLPNHREVKANDAHVAIQVKVNHKNPRTFDNYFG
jgi:hypothetical protein